MVDGGAPQCGHWVNATDWKWITDHVKDWEEIRSVDIRREFSFLVFTLCTNPHQLVVALRACVFSSTGLYSTCWILPLRSSRRLHHMVAVEPQWKSALWWRSSLFLYQSLVTYPGCQHVTAPFQHWTWMKIKTRKFCTEIWHQDKPVAVFQPNLHPWIPLWSQLTFNTFWTLVSPSVCRPIRISHLISPRMSALHILTCTVWHKDQVYAHNLYSL